MRKFYITFGQAHVHSYEGITLDKDCVVQVYAKDYKVVHEWAMRSFHGIFAFVYKKKPDMSYYPRGIIKLDMN